MVKELIIDSTPTGVTIALIEDKYLVELHKEHINNNYAVGDIYLGRIKKIMPGLNAAFVDVEYAVVKSATIVEPDEVVATV